MTNITFLHHRANLKDLPAKKREVVLNQMLDHKLNLTREEIQMLNKEQLQRHTNDNFRQMTWITPEEWAASDETQKELYSYNRQRAAISQDLFDSMDSEWRKNVLMAVNILSGYFLDKDRFDKLSDEEKKYYVNKKIIRTSTLYPHEFAHLTDENFKKIIDSVMWENSAEDFTAEQIANFPEHMLKYYKKMKKKRITESVRKYIRQIINETVSGAGTVFGPYHDEVVLIKEKIKSQYFSIALNRAGKICSNPEITDTEINCPVDYEIEKTKHSTERQFRHVNSTIEDENIKVLFDRAIDRIIKLLLSKAIQIGDEIHLKDKISDLNVIFAISTEKTNENETIIKFPLITVINKRNFVPYQNTKTIIA